MATRSMPTVSWMPDFDGDLELGADAVIGGDQHRIGEARRLEVEQPAEAADLAVGARPPVERTSGLIFSTMALPASMSTPASA